MKRGKFIILLLISFTLQGCIVEDPKYIHFSTKPEINYYTNQIYLNIFNNNEDYFLDLYNTNLSKNIPIPNDEKTIIENFLNEISIDNFDENIEIPDKECYQIRIRFDNSQQYLIKVFDNNILTISPWDGIYQEDIIDISNLPIRFNLYDFCKHIEHEAQLNQ